MGILSQNVEEVLSFKELSLTELSEGKKPVVPLRFTVVPVI
jgi:hypothetical protein